MGHLAKSIQPDGLENRDQGTCTPRTVNSSARPPRSRRPWNGDCRIRRCRSSSNHCGSPDPARPIHVRISHTINLDHRRRPCLHRIGHRGERLGLLPCFLRRHRCNELGGPIQPGLQLLPAPFRALACMAKQVPFRLASFLARLHWSAARHLSLPISSSRAFRPMVTSRCCFWAKRGPVSANVRPQGLRHADRSRHKRHPVCRRREKHGNAAAHRRAFHRPMSAWSWREP